MGQGRGIWRRWIGPISRHRDIILASNKKVTDKKVQDFNGKEGAAGPFRCFLPCPFLYRRSRPGEQDDPPVLTKGAGRLPVVHGVVAGGYSRTGGFRVIDRFVPS